ncbi:MAG: hypothetical protein VCE74_03665, partial [Alphaproteobacteria bacterium]
RPAGSLPLPLPAIAVVDIAMTAATAAAETMILIAFMISTLCLSLIIQYELVGGAIAACPKMRSNFCAQIQARLFSFFLRALSTEKTLAICRVAFIEFDAKPVPTVTSKKFAVFQGFSTTGPPVCSIFGLQESKLGIRVS